VRERDYLSVGRLF